MRHYTEEFVSKLWEVLPEEAVAVAVDKSGNLYWYMSEPYVYNSFLWNCRGNALNHFGKVTYDGDWKDTLRTRPKVRWVPKVGDKYWGLSIVLGESNIYPSEWTEHCIDKTQLKNGLVFQTKEQAQACAERMLKAAKEGV